MPIMPRPSMVSRTEAKSRIPITPIKIIILRIPTMATRIIAPIVALLIVGVKAAIAVGTSVTF
jgi:hypothetical protein